MKRERVIPTITVLAASMALMTSCAWAMPINYSEGLSGDLPDPRTDCCTPDWGAHTTLTADIGSNQIRGSYESLTSGSVPITNDIDPFKVIVPDRLVVRGVRFFYELTDVENLNSFAYRVELAGYDADGILKRPGASDELMLVSVNGFPIDVEGSPIALFESATILDNIPPDFLPLESAEWRFYPGMAFATWVGGQDLDHRLIMNYRIVLDVRRVPEPSSLASFGVGLFVLALARRRSFLATR